MMRIDFLDDAERELFARLSTDAELRLRTLYKIVVKGDDEDDDGLVMTFQPNRAQRRLLKRLHHRNLILKARQLGYTTLICMLWLDTALWSTEPVRCGIIAQDREAAEAIFRGKVRFAYERLPEFIRRWFPLAKSTANELEFGHNGSSIRVATSMRSGTIHRLHISEFGKICAKYPDKAREVVTGSIPAVPKSGICVIESTAEGQDGYFYEMSGRAQALAEQQATLTARDWRFHFAAWWMAPEYTIDPTGVVFTEADLTYFAKVEATIGRPLTEGQRAWYVTTRRADFADEAPLMWQEYPSYPEEAFQVSTEGCYYATQLAAARKQGRILPTLPIEAAPVNTFWDLGRGDMTAIWCHQRVGPENRWIRYYEASGEDLSHYVQWLQRQGFTFGVHYLPHDAAYKRLGETPDTNLSLEEMLARLMPGQRFEVVPRVSTTAAGIQATRNQFASCWFSEEGCGQGIKRLGNYRKQWDKSRGCWREEPLHDENSHGCLTGDTLVLSERGEVPIRDVKIGDRVWTPAGYARVLNSGPTKIACELIEITTSDGATIVATPEHKFFTTRGVVTADTLSKNDSIFHRWSFPCLSSQSIESMGFRDAVIESFEASVTGTGQPETSMSAKRGAGSDCCTSRYTQPSTASQNGGGGLGLRMAITAISARVTGFTSGLSASASTVFKNLTAFVSTGSQRATTRQITPSTRDSQCTATFGKSTMVQSQTGSMCTTRMATRQTTTSKILSFIQLPSIRCTTGKPIRGLGAKPTGGKSLRPGFWRSSGTQAKQGGGGTQRTACAPGRIENGTPSSVCSAASDSTLHTQRGPNIASEVAKVRRFTPRHETLVYDLTVEKHHCYLANGLLVSNSDAFRQFGQVAEAGEKFQTAIAVARPPGSGMFKRRGSAMAV